jgi:hypothetical protein
LNKEGIKHNKENEKGEPENKKEIIINEEKPENEEIGEIEDNKLKKYLLKRKTNNLRK